MIISPIFQKVSPQLRILVIDDSLTARKMMKEFLYDIGFKDVTEAVDGEGAKKLIADKRIELVISDWEMPGLTGLELLKEIRTDVFKKELPFIMMTSNSAKDQVVDALQHGVTDYIVKPFNRETVESKLCSIYGVSA